MDANPNERSPYDVLGLRPDASDAEIKAAYRARSMLYHPDRLADLPEAARKVALAEMKALNEAYAVLKDPLKRAALQRKRPAPPETPEEDTRLHKAEHGAGAPTVPAAPSVRVHVTAGQATQPPYVPGPSIFPPHAAHTPPPPPPPPAPIHNLRADLARFLLFGAVGSPGWVLVMALVVLAPALGWVGALGLGAGLPVALWYIKPAKRRRPARWSRRGLLFILVLLPVVGALFLPALMSTSTAMQLAPSGFAWGLLWLTAVGLVLLAHWGVCLAAYYLT